MLVRLKSYLRQHHIAFLALFAALGGTGAYAASLGGGTVRGFNTTSAEKSGTDSGTLAKLNGLTLRFKSFQEEDFRQCALSARAADAGEVTSFSAEKIVQGGDDKSFDVRNKSLKAGGGATLALTHADAGAPGVNRTIEGHFNWRDDKTDRVVTGVFHVGAEVGRCRFDGTLTGAG